jgi:hypothetical protein
MSWSRVIVVFLLGGSAALFAQDSAYEGALKEMLEGLDKITMTLSLINSGEAAKEVRDDLKKQVDAWVKLRKKSEESEPPPRPEKDRLAKEYRPKLEMATKKFLAEIERVRRVPGAKETLQELRPVLDYKPK